MLRNGCRWIVFCLAVLWSAPVLAGATDIYPVDDMSLDNGWFFDVPAEAMFDGKLNLTVHRNGNQVGTRPLSQLVLNNCTISAKIKINSATDDCHGQLGVASGRDLGPNTFPHGVFISYGYGTSGGYRFLITDSLTGEEVFTAGPTTRIQVSSGVEYTVSLVVDGRSAILSVKDGGIDVPGSPLNATLRAPLSSYWPLNQVLIGRPHTTTTSSQTSASIDDVWVTSTDAAWAPPLKWTVQTLDPLPAARHNHGAILLPNGKVLVAGGIVSGSATKTCLLFDPAAVAGSRWAAASPMSAARHSHGKGMVLLPNGKVLVTGGYDSGPLTSAELYDPGTDNWSNAGTGTMPYAYADHSAILLPNNKVLVAGGRGTGMSYNKVCCLYDPDTNSWQTTGSSTDERTHAGFARLSNGKILAAGGATSGANISTSELYDTFSGTWSTTGSFIQPPAARYPGTAMLLVTGEVLAAGGNAAGCATTELYNVNFGSWMAGSPATADLTHTKTQATLPDGRILFMTTNAAASCLIYDPFAGTWTTPAVPFNLGIATEMTALADGRILIAGGWAGGSVTTCEIFEPDGTSVVAKPVISPPGGSFSGTVNVTITCSTPTPISIYYTTDGITEPTEGGPNSILYTVPFPVATTTTIKAKAFKAAVTESDTAFADFFIDTVEIEPDRWSVSVLEGSTANLQVKLSRQPAANVQVTATMLNATDPDLTLTSGGALTFTPTNWSMPQTLTLAQLPQHHV
jgi:hypothetical protein